MNPKWNQNRKKGVQPQSIIPRWLPGRKSCESLEDFRLFLDPLWGPQIDQNATLAENAVTRIFISFFLFSVFPRVQLAGFHFSWFSPFPGFPTIMVNVCEVDKLPPSVAVTVNVYVPSGSLPLILPLSLIDNPAGKPLTL